jgi:Na+/melibiose symporter-like transporter
MWALVFLIPWFQYVPASTVTVGKLNFCVAYSFRGLHFLISLFLFDALYTWVQLNLSALMADITSSNSERASLTMFSGIGNVAGAVIAGMRFVAINSIRDAS